MAVRHPERPVVRQPVPDGRRDRDHTVEGAAREVHLETGIELQLLGRQGKRMPAGFAIGMRSRRRCDGEPDGNEQRPHRGTVALLALVAGGAGCVTDIADQDGAFSGRAREAVYCAVNLDDSAGNDLDSIDGALDRAVARNELLHLYAHRPGVTVPLAKLEHVLAGARARGLTFVTYGELAPSEVTAPVPALALSFDDSGVDDWLRARELFRASDARVTFFVSRYDRISEVRRAGIRDLALDGHSIQAHSVDHRNAPAMVEAEGLAAYLRDEALPSIAVLRADGYDVTAFAYPYGARTQELDDALLDHVQVLRSVTFTVAGVADPCP